METIRDLKRRDWRLPRLAGTMHGIRRSRQLHAMTADQVTQQYPAIQQAVFDHYTPSADRKIAPAPHLTPAGP